MKANEREGKKRGIKAREVRGKNRNYAEKREMQKIGIVRRKER